MIPIKAKNKNPPSPDKSLCVTYPYIATPKNKVTVALKAFIINIAPPIWFASRSIGTSVIPLKSVKAKNSQ